MPECCPELSPKAITAFILVQERWTLRIVYALQPGPIGFNQMKRAVEGINSTMLAQRLVLLEQAGLVHKTVQSTMPPRTSYTLTEAGHALEPIIAAIVAWGERYVPDDPTGWVDGDGAFRAELVVDEADLVTRTPRHSSVTAHACGPD